MRKWSYPVVVFIFNYLLFTGFPVGGGGVSLGFLFTIPIIAVLTLVATGIHYAFERVKIKTGYYQFGVTTFLIILSYNLFITDPGNSPIDIIKRMSATAKQYHSITINDYFLENRYYNYERVVAAKKKFGKEITDVSYAINFFDYNKETPSETAGIMFINDRPKVTQPYIVFAPAIKDTFEFTASFPNDIAVFYGSKNFMTSDIGHRPVNPAGRLIDTLLKSASIEKNLKNNTPEEEYWAYRLFYWLL